MSEQSEQSELFKLGIKIRREVLGDAYVDKALAGGSDPFGKVGQEYVSLLGKLGKVRSSETDEKTSAHEDRPGLERKQRSLLNIGILMTLNRGPELRAHIRGALNNGLTETEISEAIRHTMIYSGVPSGVDAFKIAGAVIKEMKDSGEYKPSAK